MKITAILKVETEVSSNLNNEAIANLVNAQKEAVSAGPVGRTIISVKAQVTSCEATKAIKV